MSLGGSGFLIFIVILFAVMYFVAIRPQRRKQQELQSMLSQLKPGDEIVTVGGIYGDVIEVDDDKVTLEIAEDVHIEVARRAVAQIVQQEPFFEGTGEGEAGAEDEEPEAIEKPEPVREDRRWRMFGSRTR
jgi:preprotein translocase subunit YajC